MPSLSPVAIPFAYQAPSIGTPPPRGRSALPSSLPAAAPARFRSTVRRPHESFPAFRPLPCLNEQVPVPSGGQLRGALVTRTFYLLVLCHRTGSIVTVAFPTRPPFHPGASSKLQRGCCCSSSSDCPPPRPFSCELDTRPCSPPLQPHHRTTTHTCSHKGRTSPPFFLHIYPAMASRTAATSIARAVARSAAKPSSARTFSSVAQKAARPAARQAQAALRSAFSVSASKEGRTDGGGVASDASRPN